MARRSGSFSLGGTLEPKVDAPLDARLVVSTKSDLLNAASYPYKYIGMEVFVQSEMKKYRLVETDTTDEDSWLDLGSAVTASVYKFAGSIAFALLPQLAAGVVGNVYNITDDFTTTADFLEGAGKTYKAGTNVSICDIGTPQNPVYKYDVLTAPIDTSVFMLSVSTAPSAPASGDYIFYHGTASGDFADGIGIYKYDLANTRWVHQDLGFVEQGVVSLPFSTTTAYAVNDRCYKDGSLWKCTTAHTGTWDSADFETVTLDDVIPKPLTDAQMADVKSGFTPTNVVGVEFGGHVYSPNEHVMGKWQEVVDGVLKERPVYEKSINFGALPNKTLKSVSHGASNFDFLVDAKAIVHNTTGFWRILNLTQDNNHEFVILFQVTAASVQVYARDSDASNYDECHFTIQYTKTTDAWKTVS